jgi:3-deoxy-D-manno-octulosonic-acid transferase
VKALKTKTPDTEIVLSTATETGQQVARQKLGGDVDVFFYMPHDLPWVADALVRKIRPHFFIQVETDLWPNLLHSLHRNTVPAVLVNGRISERSFRRMLGARRVVGGMLNLFSLIFAQSEDDRCRYVSMGADPSRVVASGNLKYDALPQRALPEEALRLRASAGIEEDRPVWVAGSTHAGEYEVLLEVHCSLMRRFPDLLLVLAPRQIQEAAGISSLCDRYGLTASRRSLGESAKGKAVYLLDTMGELGTFYAVAAAAFIGGSLVPFGGHNPLEAVVQGKPVLWGPHLSNFREIEEGLLAARCGRMVDSAAVMEEILGQWLADPLLGADYGRLADTFLLSRTGVSHTILNRLLDRSI